MSGIKISKQGKYNWNMVVILTLIPIIGVFGTGIYIYYNGIVWQEPVMMFIYWFLSGMGITMGYHRLFSHKAYKTNPFVEWILMIFSYGKGNAWLIRVSSRLDMHLFCS